jgi:hypothetical protein
MSRCPLSRGKMSRGKMWLAREQFANLARVRSPA